MKSTFIAFFIFLATGSFAQDTTFYSNDHKKVPTKEESDFYTVFSIDSTDTKQAVRMGYYTSGKIKSEEHFLKYSDQYKGEENYRIDGEAKDWYENGQIKLVQHFKEGVNDGSFLMYWEDGISKRTDFYKDGKLKEGKVFDKNGKPVPYYEYEVMPSFPGGTKKMFKFLRKNIQYPKEARKKNIEGVVVVNFIVTKTGELSQIKVEEVVHPLLDAEAIRVFRQMPRWEPAKLEGVPIDVPVKFPVSFHFN